MFTFIHVYELFAISKGIAKFWFMIYIYAIDMLGSQILGFSATKLLMSGLATGFQFGTNNPLQYTTHLEMVSRLLFHVWVFRKCELLQINPYFLTEIYSMQLTKIAVFFRCQVIAYNKHDNPTVSATNVTMVQSWNLFVLAVMHISGDPGNNPLWYSFQMKTFRPMPREWHGW